MGRSSIAVLIITIAAIFSALAVASCVVHRSGNRSRTEQQAPSGEQRDSNPSNEIHQSYRLAKGARVEISDIRGKVEIETAESEQAEVHIISSARYREDLEEDKITIEHMPANLSIRGQRARRRSLFLSLLGSSRPQHRVMLKLPRWIELTAGGINGGISIGEIEGALQISGVNGRVQIAQASGMGSLSTINGLVEVGIKGLDEGGLKVSNVNGPVVLRLPEKINAELKVSGVNGPLQTELSNLFVQEKKGRSSLTARLGEGGAPITISSVNGPVRLSNTEIVKEAPAKVAAK